MSVFCNPEAQRGLGTIIPMLIPTAGKSSRFAGRLPPAFPEMMSEDPKFALGFKRTLCRPTVVRERVGKPERKINRKNLRESRAPVTTAEVSYG